VSHRSHRWVRDNIAELGARYDSYRETEATFGEDAARFEPDIDAREQDWDLALLTYLARIDRSEPIRVLLDRLSDTNRTTSPRSSEVNHRPHTPSGPGGTRVHDRVRPRPYP
jgi:hypothetical protein